MRHSAPFLSLLLFLLVTSGLTAQTEPKPPASALPSTWVDSFRWRSIGPANMGGRIVDIAVDEANPTTFWVATASGGLNWGQTTTWSSLSAQRRSWPG